MCSLWQGNQNREEKILQEINERYSKKEKEKLVRIQSLETLAKINEREKQRAG